jgi:hypothetical protein
MFTHTIFCRCGGFAKAGVRKAVKWPNLSIDLAAARTGGRLARKLIVNSSGTPIGKIK